MNALAELWGSLAETAAAAVQAAERAAKDLESLPYISPAEVERINGIAKQARELMEKATRQYLAEV